MSLRLLGALGTLLAAAECLAWEQGLTAPVDTDYHSDGKADARQVELGQLLFFDRILSGNQNISCASCHRLEHHTSDGLSLPLGEGSERSGETRTAGRVYERGPRNTQALFNLGAREFRRLFHDGRVQVDDSKPSGFDTPADAQLPDGLTSVLAAQAMFPVAATSEMAGQHWENPIARASVEERFAGPEGVWELLASRLRSIPAYRARFVDAFDDIQQPDDIRFMHAANALATFIASAFRADDSAFDRYLRGDALAMSPAAQRGARLFYGEAGCAGCHAGVFQTDHDFHAIGVPQIGPGKSDGLFGREDFGRERVTGKRADRYRFRTPSLRNVARTGPWGHSGAFGSLRAMLLHHLDPERSLDGYDRSQAVLPFRRDLARVDFVVLDDRTRREALLSASEIHRVQLTPAQIDDLLDFLAALTDQSEGPMATPAAVPSGLPVGN